MEKKEQILAALKKLGATSPSAIADHTGLSPSLAGYHLRALLKDEAIKAIGTSNNRQYALPEQEFTDAQAPQPHKEKKSKKAKRASKKTRTPRARATAPTQAPDFLAAMTFDQRIALVEDGVIRRFTPEQSSAIADLVLANYTS